MRILEDGGIGLPEYYEWRTRSGCYFCFYQRKAEWIGLADRHPELFDRAVAIEQKVLLQAGTDGEADFSDHAMRGRQYTWSGGETLVQLRSRRDEILARHAAAMFPRSLLAKPTFPSSRPLGMPSTKTTIQPPVPCALYEPAA